MKLKKIKISSILYIVSAISFLVLLPFTSYYYSSLQENLRKREEYEDKIEEKNNELKELDGIVKNLGSDENASNFVNKLSSSLDRGKLLQYFSNFVEKKSSSENMIKIRWISFNELWQSDLWFSEAQISLRMYFGNKDAMKTFLEFLVDQDSEYMFFLEEFSYPDFGNKELESRWFDMIINLKIYYS